MAVAELQPAEQPQQQQQQQKRKTRSVVTTVVLLPLKRTLTAVRLYLVIALCVLLALGWIGWKIAAFFGDEGAAARLRIDDATSLALHHTRRFTELSLKGFSPKTTLQVRSALESVAVTLTQEATYIGLTAAAGFPEFAQDFHDLMVGVRGVANRYNELADQSYDVFLAERDAIEVAAQYLHVLSAHITANDFEAAAFACDNLIRHLDVPLQETKLLTERAQEVHQTLQSLNATAHHLFSKTMTKMSSVQRERWSTFQRVLTYLFLTPIGGAIKHYSDSKRDQREDEALTSLAVAYHSMQTGLEEASSHVKRFKEDLIQMKRDLFNSQHSFHVLHGNAKLASRALTDGKNLAHMQQLLMLIEDARRSLLSTLTGIHSRVSHTTPELP